MENKILIYGASGHAKVVIDNLLSNGEKVHLVIDDNPDIVSVSGIPVLHTAQMALNATDRLCIAVGNNKIRKELAGRLKTVFALAIHKTAVISPQATIGDGTVIMANAVINPGSSIGAHCIINTSAVVEHDCTIADFVHISPAAALAGGVSVGEGTHIGIGACIIQGIRIGNWAMIGAGAVIIADIPDFAVVVGNPGRIIKYTEGGE